MKAVDYYQVLEVGREASQEQIQRAYRRLARRYHPDLNKEKDAEERFKVLNEAHEVLKDPQKRKLYDLYGSDWQKVERNGDHFNPFKGTEREAWSSSSARGQRGEGFYTEEFTDFFDTIFADSGEAGHFSRFSSRPKAHELELAISLEEAYAGGTKVIRLQSPSLPGNSPESRTLKVRIPKGSVDGSLIRLAGQGGSRGQLSPDLLLRLKIDPHPTFHVMGRDLVTVVPVSPWEAALGTKLEVQTMGGSVKLNIPAGSQSGRRLRLRGKGLAPLGKAAGDLLVELQIMIPEQMSVEEKELFQRLSSSSSFDPRQLRGQRAGSRQTS